VEAYLYPPQDGGDPTKDAAGLLASDWTQAHQEDGQTTTIVLARQPNLGDEAFHWYKADKGEPVVVGEVEVRSRNAVVRVAYSRDTPAKADAKSTQKRLLDEAAVVARQTVGAFV
jgi:succinyl-CoA synthetase alpha subunit